jgi:replicative DNA helicase
MSYWLKFSDFYQFPHLILFDSWEDLIQKSITTNFQEVSQKMKEYNKVYKKNLINQWNNCFFFFF